MPQNKKQAPPLDTAAGLLLTLTALSGEFPVSLVSRLRLHRMAEVLVTMHNAGVGAFPWQKHDVFSPTPPNDWISWPIYYSSREVKEIGRQQDKISGSRSTGILLTENDVFAVYNTGISEMKWEYNYESHLHVFLKFDVRHQILPGQYVDAEVSAVIFGANMDQMPVLMGVGGDKRHKYFVLDGEYDHFYYLTSDRRGETILQMLCDPEKKAVLDNVLMEGYAESRTWKVENDAMDGDTPVLFGYDCDMTRIKRFAGGVKVHGLAGTLYCFDFQEAAIRKVCGPNVDVRCVAFEAVATLLQRGQ